jgi:hypothetical protein
MRFEIRTALALVCVSTLAACTTDEAVSSKSQSVTTLNRLASNRLASNRLASNRLASNRLASNRLASNKLALDPHGAAELIATDDGRNVLSYIVSCAAPPTESLEATHGSCSTNADCGTLTPGTCDAGTCKYSFPGVLGLAPEWLGKPLGRQGKGWISACMFARVNAHDTAEEISLHGEHPALAVALDESALYTAEEGAFYGNMFTPADQPIAWYACRGEAQASGEFGGLVARDCAEPDPANPRITQCGFTYAGDCADFTPAYPSPYACEERESGDPQDCGDEHGNHDGEHENSDGGTPPPAADHGFYYEGCHTSSALGKWTHSRGYDEVITTFVTP